VRVISVPLTVIGEIRIDPGRTDKWKIPDTGTGYLPPHTVVLRQLLTLAISGI